MVITKEILKKLLPNATLSNCALYASEIDKCIKEYDINTPLRLAMFIAQIGHESGSLRYKEEIASGAAYEGRKDLGNIYAGDGRKFKGRGFIQITGRSNYTAISKAFNVDFVNNPTLLSTPEYAVKSACWWWKNHGLNEISDTGDVKKATKRINGGYNGLTDRTNLYINAKKILGI